MRHSTKPCPWKHATREAWSPVVVVASPPSPPASPTRSASPLGQSGWAEQQVGIACPAIEAGIPAGARSHDASAGDGSAEDACFMNLLGLAHDDGRKAYVSMNPKLDQQVLQEISDSRCALDVDSEWVRCLPGFRLKATAKPKTTNTAKALHYDDDGSDGERDMATARSWRGALRTSWLESVGRLSVRSRSTPLRATRACARKDKAVDMDKDMAPKPPASGAASSGYPMAKSSCIEQQAWKDAESSRSLPGALDMQSAAGDEQGPSQAQVRTGKFSSCSW